MLSSGKYKVVEFSYSNRWVYLGLLDVKKKKGVTNELIMRRENFKMDLENKALEKGEVVDIVQARFPPLTSRDIEVYYMGRRIFSSE